MKKELDTRSVFLFFSLVPFAVRAATLAGNDGDVGHVLFRIDGLLRLAFLFHRARIAAAGIFTFAAVSVAARSFLTRSIFVLHRARVAFATAT
jgi:hypothetical protein